MAFGSTYDFFLVRLKTLRISIFSLKNHGAEQEVDGMFDMGSEVMDLPLEEKMKFEEGDSEMAFG